MLASVGKTEVSSNKPSREALQQTTVFRQFKSRHPDILEMERLLVRLARSRFSVLEKTLHRFLRALGVVQTAEVS